MVIILILAQVYELWVSLILKFGDVYGDNLKLYKAKFFHNLEDDGGLLKWHRIFE